MGTSQEQQKDAKARLALSKGDSAMATDNDRPAYDLSTDTLQEHRINQHLPCTMRNLPVDFQVRRLTGRKRLSDKLLQVLQGADVAWGCAWDP